VPHQPGDPTESSADAEAERAAVSSVEVLVVDDDAAMAGSIVEILGLRGITAAAVTSATAAITGERELSPAVVVCDQRLPDMTGLDLCAAIRAIDPDVTLILLTGHASLDSAIAAVGQIDQYLTKPAPPDELIRSVEAGTRKTARRRAERRDAEQAATRLAAIIEGTDDAVIAMTLDGTITGWNRGAEHIYGYPAAAAIGQPAAILVPPEHPNDLTEILTSIRDGHHVEHFETIRMRSDTTLLHVSLTVSPIHDASHHVIGASSIARDITDRLAAEELRQQLEGSAARHGQALQINDSIVQYLVLAQARLELGDVSGGAAALDEGLGRARGLIDDLLPDRPATPAEPTSAIASPPDRPDGSPECTVVIADDSEEIRVLVRMLLELAGGGYAADGHEAVAAADTLHPDLVLLDQSMPNLDGLTAIPRIREVSPGSAVVMLSGFSAARLSATALEQGATAYITKADLATALVPELRRILCPRQAVW
jgi:PAS domain S-box-containing protein